MIGLGIFGAIWLVGALITARRLIRQIEVESMDKLVREPYANRAYLIQASRYYIGRSEMSFPIIFVSIGWMLTVPAHAIAEFLERRVMPYIDYKSAERAERRVVEAIKRYERKSGQRHPARDQFDAFHNKLEV
jgi:hypothetical protein